MKKRNWAIGIEILLATMLTVMLALIFCTNTMHYHYRINADIASEGILARLIWESGEWILVLGAWQWKREYLILQIWRHFSMGLLQI